jgi:insertion element IS1 protein InsB
MIASLAERPVLELDELWSFVGHKGHVVWVWVALERQTRRIVGFAVGDRSEAACRRQWASLPPDYRTGAICYTDFYRVYAKVLPSKRHRRVGKETRFNNTLRQRCANLVRKTLSFSRKRALSRDPNPPLHRPLQLVPCSLSRPISLMETTT